MSAYGYVIFDRIEDFNFTPEIIVWLWNKKGESNEKELDDVVVRPGVPLPWVGAGAGERF
jgi:hypothetical protein